MSSPALTRLALTFNSRACAHVCVCACVCYFPRHTIIIVVFVVLLWRLRRCCHCCWWRLISARICANISLEFELRSRQRRLSALKFGTYITVAADRCRLVCVRVKINAQNKFKFRNKINCANSAKIYKSTESFA